MASLIIQDSTLTSIADAIRAKTGDSGTMTPSQMVTAIGNITSGGSGDEMPNLITIEPSYWSYYTSGQSWQTIHRNDWLLQNHLDKIKFQTSQAVPGLDYFLYNNSIQADYSQVEVEANFPSSMIRTFAGSSLIKPPRLVVTGNNNVNVSRMTELFYDCNYMTEIPNNFWDNKLMFFTLADWTPTNSTETYRFIRLFAQCYELESIPDNFWGIQFEQCSNFSDNQYSGPYCYMFDQCKSLGQINGLGVTHVAGSNSRTTADMFNHMLSACYRLKDFTFYAPNNTPRVARWADQTLDLTGIGYVPQLWMLSLPSNAHYYPSDSNSSDGYKDFVIYDQSTYNQRKNMQETLAIGKAWSRYNHDSMVRTINSLPDTSATGTNIIQFASGQGSSTDAGGPENLTQAEIAVATAKGWQVQIV